MKRYALALALVLPAFAAMPEIDKAKSQGNPAAPITMEVFVSLDCSHCRALHEETMPLVVRDFVTAGKVYLTYREFPLTGQYHPYAKEAATYAVAAGRLGKYAPVSDALFKSQAAWAMNGNVWSFVTPVLSAAEQKRVQLLAKDPGVVAEVEREYQEGVAAGINATPTVIVTKGAQRYPIQAEKLRYDLLKSLLDGMLK